MRENLRHRNGNWTLWSFATRAGGGAGTYNTKGRWERKYSGGKKTVNQPIIDVVEEACQLDRKIFA